MKVSCVDIDWAARPLRQDMPGEVLRLGNDPKVVNLTLGAAGHVETIEWLGDLARKERLSVLNLRIGEVVENGAAVQALADWAARLGLAFNIDLIVPDTLDVPAWYTARDAQVGRVLDTTQALRSAGHSVRWLLVLSPDLIYRLETITGLALAQEVKPVLVPQAIMRPDAAPLEPNDHLFVWDFLQYSILGERAAVFSRSELAAYRVLRDQSLTAAGGKFGDLQSGTWHDWTDKGVTKTMRPGARIAAPLLAGAQGADAGQSLGAKLRMAAEDLAEVGGIGLSAHLRSRIVGTKRRPAKDAPMPHVVLIGAYGGEHIGDAAILGGVLERIHARHGTQKAILMTQRPTHTKHLMPMLDVPVDLEVWDYTYANIAKAMKQVDGVVYAGGPLTDIPKHLVRHLETATRAKHMGKPFVMEGIGPHWFPRWGSRVTARKLVETADYITIRVKDDAKYDVVKDIDFVIGHDPAFDYLKTREPALTRLPEFELPQLETLLDGTQGRPIIGINIRPIGHLYADPPAGMSKKAFTAQVVDKFEREMAKAITEYARKGTDNPCFIFFPMNAIQFGMSDLKSAWRIMRHLGPGVDFRLWQADASLDGVVHLLRHIDTVIAMRFHAAIFALSQGCEVIGIDYVIGKRDKVAAVLTDAGRPDGFCRIDELESHWLVNKLDEAAHAVALKTREKP